MPGQFVRVWFSTHQVHFMCPTGPRDSAHDPWRLTPPPDIFEHLELPPFPELIPDPIAPPMLPTPSVLGGQTIDHVQLRGRMWFAPVVTAEAGDECITIRADDAHNQEQWFELTLSAETLAELLGRVMLMRPNCEAAALDVLRALGAHFPR